MGLGTNEWMTGQTDKQEEEQAVDRPPPTVGTKPRQNPWDSQVLSTCLSLGSHTRRSDDRSLGTVVIITLVAYFFMGPGEGVTPFSRSVVSSMY